MDNYNYDSFGQCDAGAPDFRSVARIGSQAPDFCLSDLDGHQLRCRHSGGSSMCFWSSAASPDRRLWGRFLH
jgi:hypothetical protein